LDRGSVLKQFFCKIAHFAAGFSTALVSTLNAVLSILLFITFLVYELDEDWHISDEAYRDILEYAVGLYTASILIFIVKLFT
jgi:hypothetical protein